MVVVAVSVSQSWDLMSAHSTCMLRSRSPFFTPPCSILAPRLVPITPSLTGHKLAKQHWAQMAFVRLTKMEIISMAKGQNVSFEGGNLQHLLSQHLRVLKAAYTWFNFFLFGSGGSGPRASLCKRWKSQNQVKLAIACKDNACICHPEQPLCLQIPAGVFSVPSFAERR